MWSGTAHCRSARRRSAGSPRISVVPMESRPISRAHPTWTFSRSRPTRRRGRRRGTPRSTTTHVPATSTSSGSLLTSLIPRTAGTRSTPATCSTTGTALIDDEYDGTVVQDQTIEQMTDTYGAGAAWFSMYLGCDGNPFYVDGYQVGSTVSGWNAFDFEDFFHVNVSLRVRGGPISTCHTSPARFPNPVSFKGRITPGAAWQGQQFVGRRNGRWRIVARGASANIASPSRERELLLRRRAPRERQHGVQPQ